jgi:hypothetical protein
MIINGLNDENVNKLISELESSGYFEEIWQSIYGKDTPSVGEVSKIELNSNLEDKVVVALKKEAE